MGRNFSHQVRRLCPAHEGTKKWDGANSLRSSRQGVQGSALHDISEDEEDDGTLYGSFVMGESD